MKRLVEKDGKFELVDAGILNYALDVVVNPVTLKPVTGGQALLFGGALFAVGLGVGATVWSKQGKKLASVFATEEQMKAYA